MITDPELSKEINVFLSKVFLAYLHSSWHFVTVRLHPNEWFDDYEYYMNHMPCPLALPGLNEHLWEILTQNVRQPSLPSSSKHQMRPDETLLKNGAHPFSRRPATCRILF